MKTKVLNPPERIYLQVVGEDDFGEDVPYSDVDTGDVTWHDERIFESDVEYRLVKRSVKNRGEKR